MGPHFWPDDSLKRALQNQPNVYAPGRVPYSAIPAVMAHFDVCIVPHRQSEFVESLNPIKLWEYLACGKPIVSTDVAGFRDYPRFVRLARSTRDFVDACRAALLEINELTASPTDGISAPTQPSPLLEGALALREARRKEARQHSWRARVDVLLDRWRTLGLLNAEISCDEGTHSSVFLQEDSSHEVLHKETH